jgi:hypothetical protein
MFLAMTPRAFTRLNDCPAHPPKKMKMAANSWECHAMTPGLSQDLKPLWGNTPTHPPASGLPSDACAVASAPGKGL